jgi:DNA replication protein DnaC
MKTEMEHIKNLIPAALSTLQTPTPKRPAVINPAAWDWYLVGNETADEVQELTDMLNAAQQFVNEVREGGEPRWLTFVGLSGAGKTHLAKRIGDWLRKHGERYYNKNVRDQLDPYHRDMTFYFGYAQEGNFTLKWGTLIEELRNRDFYRWARACKDHYKVIDDLGTNSFDREAQATPFAVQSMSELLDRRLRKWTVITANFTRKQFAEKFDVRIASRLSRGDNVIVESNVRDYDLRRELLTKQPTTKKEN